MTKGLQWDLDADVYHREAVFSACRRWSAEASFKIVKSGKKRYRVTALAKSGVPAVRLKEIRDGFENEVMHQELRSAALRDAGPVREAVIMRALVSASTENA